MDFERYSMIYRKEDNKDKIRIFGEHFVKNNKNKCKIIYKNKVYPLKEFLIDKGFKYQHEIKIQILLGKYIYNKSYMFDGCTSLIEFYYKENRKYMDYSNVKLFTVNNDLQLKNI